MKILKGITIILWGVFMIAPSAFAVDEWVKTYEASGRSIEGAYFLMPEQTQTKTSYLKGTTIIPKDLTEEELAKLKQNSYFDTTTTSSEGELSYTADQEPKNPVMTGVEQDPGDPPPPPDDPPETYFPSLNPFGGNDSPGGLSYGDDQQRYKDAICDSQQCTIDDPTSLPFESLEGGIISEKLQRAIVEHYLSSKEKPFLDYGINIDAKLKEDLTKSSLLARHRWVGLGIAKQEEESIENQNKENQLVVRDRGNASLIEDKTASVSRLERLITEAATTQTSRETVVTSSTQATKDTSTVTASIPVVEAPTVSLGGSQSGGSESNKTPTSGGNDDSGRPGVRLLRRLR